MNVKLVVVGGDAAFKEVRLRLPTTIGRGRECSVALPHRLVSRLHCEIRESEGKLLVRDLGSLNGTYIADERITEAELPADGLLTVGHVTFRAVYGPAYDASDEGLAAADQPVIETGCGFRSSIHDDEDTTPMESETVYDDSRHKQPGREAADPQHAQPPTNSDSTIECESTGNAATGNAATDRVALPGDDTVRAPNVAHPS